MNTPRPIPLPSVSIPPTPRPRLSSDDRRRQLLHHAIALFSRHGFSGTRTKDIAAACGVSEAILFRHFATKEDLYHAILDTHEVVAGEEEWLAEMKARADKRDDLGFIQGLVTQILKSFREDTAFHRLMLYAGLEGQSLPVLFHERTGTRTRQFIRNYIVLRQKEGAFPKGSADSLVLLLVAPAMQYATTKYIFGVKCVSRSDKDIAEEFTKFIVTALHLSSKSLENKKKRKTS